jgi:hypothetical protein
VKIFIFLLSYSYFVRKKGCRSFLVKKGVLYEGERVEEKKAFQVKESEGGDGVEVESHSHSTV